MSNGIPSLDYFKPSLSFSTPVCFLQKKSLTKKVSFSQRKRTSKQLSLIFIDIAKRKKKKRERRQLHSRKPLFMICSFSSFASSP